MDDTQIKHITHKAVDLAGGPARISRRINRSRQAVSNWSLMPPEHVLTIEKMIFDRVAKGEISASEALDRYDIRPDVYGPRITARSAAQMCASDPRLVQRV